MFIESFKSVDCPEIGKKVQLTLVHVPHKNIPRPDKHFSSCDSGLECGAAKQAGKNTTYDWSKCPFQKHRF